MICYPLHGFAASDKGAQAVAEHGHGLDRAAVGIGPMVVFIPAVAVSGCGIVAEYGAFIR